MKSLIFALLVVSAVAQSDNRYCTKDNTWIGTGPGVTALRDGPSSLPVSCFNTDPANTPSPGPVVTVTAAQKVQDAYNAATCGTTLLLAHGTTWNERLNFAPKNCDDQHWITITTDGLIPPPGHRVSPRDAPEMANFSMKQTSGLDSVGDHIRFVGIYWTRSKPGLFYYLPAMLTDSNKIIFDRNYVHGDPGEETQHGISVKTGKYIAVIDSWMDEFHCIAKTGACTDSQTISGGVSAQGSVMDSGPVKIVNNFLEAAGENILFGGGIADGPGPADIEVRRNYLYKDPRWNPSAPDYIGTMYIVKNLFEMKNGVRVLIEGNVLENNWGGFTQKGHAVLFTPKNQAGTGEDANLCPNCAISDVTFRYNIVRNAAGFVQAGSGTNDNGAYSKGQHRLSIHDNIVDGLQYPTCYQCAVSLIQIGSGYSANNIPEDETVLSDVSLLHNTVIAIGDLRTGKWGVSALLNLSGIPPGVTTVQVNNIHFENNLVSAMNNGMTSTGGGTNNCTTFAKPFKPVNIWPICYIGTSPFTGNVLVGYPSSTTDWPENNLFAPSMLAVGFDNLLGGVYSIPQDSPYFGKGANTDAVNLATFGVTDEAGR